MCFTGYISKHLYSRIAGNSIATINTPLDIQELKVLKALGVPFTEQINSDGYSTYIVDANFLRTVFCR